MGHARKHRIGLPHRALAAQGQLGIQRGLFRLASALSTCHCQDGCVSSLGRRHPSKPPQFCSKRMPNQWELASQREPDSSCSYGLNAVRQKEALM